MGVTQRPVNSLPSSRRQPFPGWKEAPSCPGGEAWVSTPGLPAGCARSFPLACGAPSRAGRGGDKRVLREGPRAVREDGGRFYCFLSPSSSRASPRRHWKAARAARRRVIYSAGCARVTEPGPTDGAADALGRGAESAGLRAGRRRQWGSVCAAAVAAGGRGRGAGSRSPTPLPLARDPPKGNRPLLPLAGPRQLLFSFLLKKFNQLSFPRPNRFHLPRFPFWPPNMTRQGALAGRGRPLCASRGAGPAQGAPSGGRGDRGAGSAGQVTYPGPGAGALFGSGEGRGPGVGVDAGQPFWDSCLPSTPRSPPRGPARRKPT